MKKLLILSLFFLLVACGSKQHADFIIAIANDQAFEREELVEVPINAIAKQVKLVDEEQYIIFDDQGNQLPYQISYDDNLLFVANVKAGGETKYTIAVGEPIEPKKLVEGRHYPKYLDDVAWENNCIAYRAYGSDLQCKKVREYGYDVWVKRVPELVVEQRYEKHFNPDIQNEVSRLRKARKHNEANELYNSVSYHVDHGDGLDCYKVGPTLGCGTAALMQGDNIIYPHCWKECEIMENGPLRFTVKLSYNPFVLGRDSIVETRVISLERGSQLNKTIVSYAGLSKSMPIATGLVIHPENPTAYVLEREKGYIAYADLTDNANNDNGIIYVGAVIPNKVIEVKSAMFSDKEVREREALGHALAISTYRPNGEYTYYWGAGWSKFGYESMESWTDYLNHYAKCVRNPLKVIY